MSAMQPHSPAELPPSVDAPVAPVRTLLLAVVALIVGAVAAEWIESGGRRPVPAFLQVRTVFVTAHRSCRVLSHSAAPGDRVTIGTPLVALSDSELEQRLEATRAQVEMLTTELRQAEARAKLELAQNERDLEYRICQLRLQAANYRQHKFESELYRNLLADRLAAHESALWDTGETLLKSLVLDQRWPQSERMQTTLQLQSCDHLVELFAENVEICEARIAGLERHREALPGQIRESCGVEVTAARLRQAQAEVERLEQLQTQLTLTSPAVGQVGEYRTRPGDQLRPGDLIVELLDDSQRYLVAEVPSQRIHEFPPGRTVWLVFPGQERRQGRVGRIAPQARPRNPAEPDADPIILVDIEQAGRLWPTVPSGARIDVYVDELR